MQSNNRPPQSLLHHLPAYDGLNRWQPISVTARDIQQGRCAASLKPRHREATKLALSATLFSLLAGALLLLTAASAGAEDVENGKTLHDQACTGCHGTDVYSRQDRKIDSLAALEHQVQRCANQAAKVDWSAPQIDAVVNYLNKTFYGFENSS